MDLDPLLLSRVQFAWLIAWHIMLPAFTIGLASYIAFLETLYFTGGRGLYLRISTFWTRIFAIAFGMGVVSGIVMPFQFGTNWSRFADGTANVLSPLFAYEGLLAFFLEASFLGVLLFGRDLVPRWAHLVAAYMVAAGTLFSAFWILAANSWMQTPAGHVLRDGMFYAEDWLQVIFTPSFPFRFAHTVIASYITTGFVVLGVAARLILRGRFREEGRTMFSVTLWLLTILVPLQIYVGDLHGLNTLEHQPAKLAAIEGNWEAGAREPLTLFAWPDQQAETNHYAVEVPLLGSIILTHSADGVVPGLTQFAPEDRPPVAVVFFTFRLMVGIGLIFLAIVLTSLVLRARRRLYDARLFLRACIAVSPLGFVAVLAGWVTTEVGRQPWTVYGLMRTADSVSPSLTGADVAASLLTYIAAYLVIFPAGVYFMGRVVRSGPSEPASHPGRVESGRPSGPARKAIKAAGDAHD